MDYSKWKRVGESDSDEDERGDGRTTGTGAGTGRGNAVSADAWALKRLADEAFAREDMVTCIDMYTRVLEYREVGPEVDRADELLHSSFLNIAAAHSKLGNWNEIHRLCIQADELARHPKASYFRSYAFAQQGKHSDALAMSVDAIKRAERAAGDFPEISEWHAQLSQSSARKERDGWEMMKEGELDAAIDWFQTSLRDALSAEERARIVNNLSACFVQKGDLAKAASVLEDAADSEELPLKKAPLLHKAAALAFKDRNISTAARLYRSTKNMLEPLCDLTKGLPTYLVHEFDCAENNFPDDTIVDEMTASTEESVRVLLACTLLGLAVCGASTRKYDDCMLLLQPSVAYLKHHCIRNGIQVDGVSGRHTNLIVSGTRIPPEASHLLTGLETLSDALASQTRWELAVRAAEQARGLCSLLGLYEKRASLCESLGHMHAQYERNVATVSELWLLAATDFERVRKFAKAACILADIGALYLQETDVKPFNFNLSFDKRDTLSEAYSSFEKSARLFKVALQATPLSPVESLKLLLRLVDARFNAALCATDSRAALLHYDETLRTHSLLLQHRDAWDAVRLSESDFNIREADVRLHYAVRCLAASETNFAQAHLQECVRVYHSTQERLREKEAWAYVAILNHLRGDMQGRELAISRMQQLVVGPVEDSTCERARVLKACDAFMSNSSIGIARTIQSNTETS